MTNQINHFLITYILCSMALTVKSQEFFDDFNGKRLDTKVWEKVNRKWGEDTTKARHGGVIGRNVFLKDGNLVIQANGNLYKGIVWGHGQKTKVGGAISTRQKFASGSYEIRAKICPQPGALSAFWTYYNQHDSINHEIDFEFPGKNQEPNGPKDSDIHWGLMTNWRGVKAHEFKNADKYFGNQTDGQYHLYRFEWHTGSEGEKRRVEWYYDNQLLHTSYDMVPTIASNFWVGIWFPWWIGNADFNTDYMYVDWIRIRPFHEAGDQLRQE